MQTVRAARLIGAATVLTGLSAQLSEALIGLGVDMDALNTAQHKAAEAMYRSAAGAQPGGAPGGEQPGDAAAEGAPKDGVIDAEVVDEGK